MTVTRYNQVCLPGYGTLQNTVIWWILFDHLKGDLRDDNLDDRGYLFQAAHSFSFLYAEKCSRITLPSSWRMAGEVKS